jgi:glycosyltransferase involved in cell wall biosynthesis
MYVNVFTTKKNKINKTSSKDYPLITVITAVLNNEKFIEETILSILNQTYKNIEYIIIDGGSTDKTIDIIKKYENAIDLWISEKDNGIYDAFNKGMSLSTGEMLGFVNSDDILYPEAIQILVNYIKKNDVDFIFGSVRKHYALLSGYKPWKIKFSWGFYTSHSTGFFIKTTSAKKVGQYNLKYKYSSDYDYLYRMIVHCGMKGLGTKRNEIFGCFRRGGFSSKINFIEHLKEEIRIRKDNGQYMLTLIFIITLKVLFNIKRVFKK